MIDPTRAPGAAEVSKPHGGRSAFSSPPFRSVELLAMLAFFCMLSACSPTKRLAVEPVFPESQTERSSAVDHSVPDIEYRLRSEVAVWAGAPHALGGTTAEGIDCSAFVQNVYKSAFNLPLPRTTSEQVHAGESVQRRDLRPGDLVFFRPPTKSRHVGIYLNDGEFAHVSSSQGVTISDLNQEYWEQSYWTSRRVLAESDRPALAGPSQAIENRPLPSHSRNNDEPKRERIGW